MTKVMGPLLLLLLTFGLTNPELSAHFPDADSSFRAREPLNAGVQAFKNGDYAQAIEDFKQLKTLDPSRLIARLYLATAYASLFIPGIPEENNKRRGEQDVEEFQEVLDIDSQNISSTDGIGSILYNMAGMPFDTTKMKESRSYHLQPIQ
jgi:tetratricopeptide (TPR) repeat protein